MTPVTGLISDAFNRHSLVALYIDLQKEWLNPSFGQESFSLNKRTFHACASLAQNLREKHVPNWWVIYAPSVDHEEGSILKKEQIERLSPERKLLVGNPAPDEPVITKASQSAVSYKNTTVTGMLTAGNKNTVLLAGVNANACVLSTARSLIEQVNDVNVIVVYDCVNSPETREEYLASLRADPLLRHKTEHLQVTTMDEVVACIG